MSRILTFDTHEDEAFKHLFEDSQKKNLETKLELHNRCADIRKENQSRVSFPPSSDIGKGLELICLIELEVVSGEYYYSQAIDYMLPATYENNSYKSIPKLVKGVHERVQHLDETRYGVKVKPVLYTLTKETPIFTNEQRQEFKEALKNIPQIKEELKNMPFIERIKLRSFFRFLSAVEGSERGLTEKEREEFERLYFKEGQ